MMKYRGVVLAAALLAVPLAATAQPVSGLYVSGGVGMDLPQNVGVVPGSAAAVGGTSHLRMEENLGFDGIGAVGYGLGDGFRFEIEGDFRRNGINSLGGMPVSAGTSGAVHTYGVMVNALYDMDIGLNWLYPYLGVGAGYQWTNLDGFTESGVGNAFHSYTDDTQGAPAGQLIAGVSMPIAAVPGLSATVEYRFMDILGGEKFAAAEAPVGGGAPIHTSYELHNQFNHMFLVGLRYVFNVGPAPKPAPPAAPAAVAAPAPAPTRSYLVFFDWDKATLTDRAREIVREAAQNSTRVQYTRIMVNGYTDTSGSARYNMGLSIRRAKAVEGQLVADGVPDNAIGIHGYGETHLLVPTGNGVREPQNRRVEIIIQ